MSVCLSVCFLARAKSCELFGKVEEGILIIRKKSRNRQGFALIKFSKKAQKVETHGNKEEHYSELFLLVFSVHKLHKIKRNRVRWKGGVKWLTKSSKVTFLQDFFFCFDGLLFLLILSISKYSQFKIYQNILSFWVIQKLTCLREVKFHLVT